MPAFAAWLVLLPISVLGLAEQANARSFSVPQAKSAFYAQTGMRLVDFRAASTPDAASLRTTPYRTRRFGTFQLFVLNPRKLYRMRRVFTHGVRPDARGIHWVSDRVGGWIAVTVYERNLLLAWFPPYGSRGILPGWTRLDRAVRRFAPRARPGAARKSLSPRPGSTAYRQGPWRRVPRANYFGATVNLAARVSSLASGGEVLVTGSTAALAPDLDGVLYESRGRQILKNVAGPSRSLRRCVCRSRDEWQLYEECRAYPLAGLDPDTSSHTTDQLAADVETEARTTDCVDHLGNAVELLEDSLLLGLRNTDPLVANGYAKTVFTRLEANLYPAAAR
jgi:Adenylate and Guanylate cyclase catalytic domain